MFTSESGLPISSFSPVSTQQEGSNLKINSQSWKGREVGCFSKLWDEICEIIQKIFERCLACFGRSPEQSTTSHDDGRPFEEQNQVNNSDKKTELLKTLSTTNEQKFETETNKNKLQNKVFLPVSLEKHSNESAGSLSVDSSSLDDELLDSSINQPKDSNTQNILLLGRAWSGKTTLLNTLKDICSVAQKKFIHTEQPSLTTIDISGVKLNVMDTPGLFLNGYGDKNDEIIESIANKAQEFFLGKRFRNVDTVIMTIQVMENFLRDDVETLNALLPQLEGNTKKILVITRGDKYCDDDMKNILSEIRSSEQFAGLIDTYFKDNVLFSGSNTDRSPINDLIYVLKKDIFNFRECLIEKLLPEQENEALKNKRQLEDRQQIQLYAQSKGAKKESEDEEIQALRLKILESEKNQNEEVVEAT